MRAALFALVRLAAGIDVTVTFPERPGYPSGQVVLSQPTVDATLTITTALTGLEEAGNKWHVHLFATDAAGGFDAGCGGAITGGHFDPFFVTGRVEPVPGAQPTYEVGDFSGKHGLLGVGTAADAATYTDLTASLFPESAEKPSILGRSIVIHKASGARWVCANIGPAGGGGRADLGAVGWVEFFQPATGAPTAITLSVSTALASSAAWRVLSLPPAADGGCDGGSSTYDPTFNGNTTAAGNLGGRFGLINAPALSGGQLVGTGTGYLLHPFLDVYGNASAAGHALLLSSLSGATIACAAIPPLGARGARVTWPAGFGVQAAADGPRGHMTLFQLREGAPTILTVSLEGLEEGNNAWHVHALPVPHSDAVRGSTLSRWVSGYVDGDCAGTGGHFNPTFGSGTSEYGDLDAKHGTLAGTVHRAVHEDETLPLFGPNSVLGRSIVIHRATGGARWACSNIGPPGLGVQAVFSATAPPAAPGSAVQTPLPTGWVRLYQQDAASPTMVAAQLSGVPAGGLGFAVHSLALDSGSSGSGAACSASNNLGGVFSEAGQLTRVGALLPAEDGIARVYGAADGLSLHGDAANSALGRSVVVYELATNAPLLCGSLGERGNTTLEQLEFYAKSLAADPLDLLVLWMRVAPPFFTLVFTAMLVAIATVCLLPGILQAIGVGYLWTYAFGGVAGVGLGGFVFWLGSFLGASIAYGLGQANPSLTDMFSEKPASTCLGRTMATMHDTPLQALCLLRIFPLVPYNLLNYYIGASYRFTFWQACLAFPCTFPLAMTWVGIGGAIVKFRLVARGEISPDKYLPFIWTGIGCAIALVVVIVGAVTYTIYQKRADEVPLEIELEHTTRKPKAVAKAESVHLCGADGDTAPVVSSGGGGGLPPPPPPPAADHADLLPGWRELVSAAGDVYFYHDETGASQWEPPLRPGASLAPPPPVPPPQALELPPPPPELPADYPPYGRSSMVAE